MFLRKFARPSMMMMMSSVAKESTAGAKARPVRELIKVYERTIFEVNYMPKDEGYRKAIEATTRERLNICEEEEQDPEAIEKRIGCGTIEELLLDAKFELRIITNLLEWDPWGIDYVCDRIDKDDQVAKVEPPGPIPDELYERLKALAKATCEKDEPKPPEESCNPDNHP